MTSQEIMYNFILIALKFLNLYPYDKRKSPNGAYKNKLA